MDSENDVDSIRQLTQVIEQSEKNPEVLKWLEEITNKEFGLIETFIQVFLQDITGEQYELGNAILKTLRKLNEFIPDQVLPQLRENQQFPIAISQYISQAKVEKLIGDAFVLLGCIFETQNFKAVANQKFVKSLLDDLSYIQDQDTFLAIIAILVSISHDLNEDFEKDIVIQTSINHPNYRFVPESISQLINEGIDSILSKCLKFTRKMYQKPQTEFFYSNDLLQVVKVCIREILNTSNDNYRQDFLQTLYCLMQTNDFQKVGKNIRQSIYDTMDEVQIFPNISAQCKQIAGDILQI